MEPKSTKFEPAIFEKTVSVIKRYWRVFLFVFILILAVIIHFYIRWNPYPVEKKKFNREKNGLFVDRKWFTGNAVCTDRAGCISVPEEDRHELIKKILRFKLQYIYINVIYYFGEGKVTDRGGAAFKKLRDEIPPGTRLLAWLNITDLDGIEDSPLWRKKNISGIKTLLSSGFDGVHFYFETGTYNKTGYLNFLRDLYNSIGGLFISQAIRLPVCPVMLKGAGVILDLKLDFFAESMKYTGQTVITAYQTNIPFEKLYIYYVSSVCGEFIDLAEKYPNHSIMAAIPATGYSLLKSSFKNAENIGNGIKGITAALEKYKNAPSSFEGIVIYTDYISSPFDWDLFGSFWTGE